MKLKMLTNKISWSTFNTSIYNEKQALNNYSSRDLIRIVWGETLHVDHDPTKIVIEIHSGTARGRVLDVGSICYRHRAVANGERCKFVVMSSFAKDRTDIALKLANYLLTRTSSASAYVYYSKIVYLFNFIDSHEIVVDFSDEEQVIDLYEQLTDHLLDRMQQTSLSNNKIGKIYASTVQLRCAEFIGIILDRHTVEIQATCTVIDQSGKSGKIPAPFEKQKRNFATHLATFHAISEFLMGDRPLPLIIEADSTKVIYYSQMEPTSQVVKLACEESFLNWKEVLQKARLLNIDLLHEKEKNYNAWREFNKNRKNYTNNRLDWRGLNLANKAIQAFQLAFIAVTTGNSSVVFNLTIDENLSGAPIPSKGKRFTEFKPRAHKDVDLEFSVRFKPHYESYITFRTWLLNKLDLNTNLAFFYLAESGVGTQKKIQIANSSTKNVLSYKTFFTRYFPNTPWLSPTLLRKGGGDYFLTNSANPMVTSMKLGNTVSTVLKNYSKTSFEQASHELISFFDGMRDRVIRDTRIDNRLIPVNIAVSGGSNTPAGHCDNQNRPQLEDGFTAKAPQPNCGVPESCLFCQHYLLHADVEDIRKLLSLREVMDNSLAKTVNHDHSNEIYAPVFHRIDEILEQLLDRHPNLAHVLDTARHEVSLGKLDSFWGIHYDFLVQSGYIS